MAARSLHEQFHVVGTQFTALEPQVCVAVPIFILRCSKLSPKQTRTSFAVLVDLDTVFQKPPTSVNHLSARFHKQNLLALRQGVLHNGNVLRMHPGVLPVLLNALAAMDTPGMTSLYDFAESVCNTTLRAFNSFVPICFHSTRRIAPGPGALFTVTLGVSLCKTNDCGCPL